MSTLDLTPLDISQVGPGFADPAADSQVVFRLVLDANSRPGKIVMLPPGILPANESGLCDAAAAYALMVLDFETPVWLDAKVARAAAFLRFHCGSPVVDDPAASRFAFAADTGTLPALDRFDLGDEDYPDRSTTLVLEVPEIAAQGGLTLRGPGIRDRAQVTIGGVDARFWRAREELAPVFPLGLDLIFVSGRHLVAVPRTTLVES
jgi:alpha-D-ribose 1-methylphosphonate 5-triphosphate synthase subunit PhnH